MSSLHLSLFFATLQLLLILYLVNFRPFCCNFTSLKKNKLLTVPAGDNVIRLAPPLIINKKHADEAINIIDETLKNLS